MVKPSPRWLLSLIALLGLLPVSSGAQGTTDYLSDHPELFVTIQDTLTMLRTDASGDTIPRSCYSSAYMFTMPYDSLCTVKYVFTECRQNNQPINLSRWILDRSVNARSMLLSFNSTTVPFTCHAGDTLSFFRELSWKNPLLNRMATNNYYALDSLDYAVELVRMSDSLRAAQLDTLGVLPNVVPGVPKIHGTRPYVSMVKYVVPPELDGQQVFIRLLVYHRGPGAYWFTRTDLFSICMSDMLKDMNIQRFQTSIYGAQNKRNVTELSTELANARLNVTQVSGLGEVLIDFASALQGRTAVAIYDVRGELLFYPYATAGSVGEDLQARYRFDRSGVYFITLAHDGQLVATKKVTITL